MAYYESNFVKIDNDTIKYNSNLELYVDIESDPTIAHIDDEDTTEETPEAATATYSSNKIKKIIEDNQYKLPIASNLTLGGIKIDNTSITVDEDGVAHSHLSIGSLATNIDNIKDGQILKYSASAGVLVNADLDIDYITEQQILDLFNGEYTTDTSSNRLSTITEAQILALFEELSV